MRLLITAMFVLALAPLPAGAQPADPDSKAIKEAALDYIEGWYEGNVERMTRAVHPELVKRIVTTDKGISRIDAMGASKLIAQVRNGGGTKTPPERRQKDVAILDRFENAATVKIVASDWVDYLQLSKFNNHWVIVNVLWEMKPKKP